MAHITFLDLFDGILIVCGNFLYGFSARTVVQFNEQYIWYNEAARIKSCNTSFRHPDNDDPLGVVYGFFVGVVFLLLFLHCAL